MVCLLAIGCAPESPELPPDNSQNEMKPERAAEIDALVAEAHSSYPNDLGIW